MRVLYICGVGPFGGSSRSLYEAVKALPDESVEPYFIAVRGSATTYYAEVAVDMITTTGLTRFDNSRYSHYRGLRWLVLLRELCYLPFTLAAILRAKLRWGHFDVIHANDIMEIVPLLIAKLFFRAPIVIHVRSLVRVDNKSLRCRWLNARLINSVDAVVAIDENVRATLPAEAHVDVIHNAFTPKRAAKSDPAILHKLESLSPQSLKVGFVGNLFLCKGLQDLLEAAKIVRRSRQDVEFVIAGGAARSDRGLKVWLLDRLGLTQDIQSRVIEEVERDQMSEAFHLLGATDDIQSVYESIDVLCFPGHAEAPGRPIFEAAFSSVPSISAVKEPRPDTFVPGETGVAIPAKDPEKLAKAILYFADDRSEVKRMGSNARKLAEKNFDPHTNAARLLDIYSRVLCPVQPPHAQEVVAR